MKDDTDRSGSARRPDSAAESRVSPDTEQLAAQMSALLADLVRTPAADLADWSPALRAGDRLGRFTLVRELGRGGMGVVWEAEDPELSRRVALKVVRPGASTRVHGRAWLLREAEAVARLSHPNIVTLFDFGLADSGPYLVFELLRGQPLDRRLRAGPLPFDSVLAIGLEVARALVHAHRAGVVHRDLKPANVYVADGGEVKVLDFGLATLLGRTGPREGGTPAFMAPEQWRGELGDERTDLFALGVTLFAALTGGVPYPVTEGRSAAERPGPTPRLPAAAAPARFRRLVERCLERDPARRPASSKAVLEELRAQQASLEGRGRRRLVAGLVLAVLAAAGTAGWLWWTRDPPPGERLTLVVADADNQAGDPGLDRLGQLVATSLEQSRRLAVVPRARLAALAREARLGEVPRVDAATARRLARLAGARVLVLPAARRDGAGLLLELRGLDPVEDRRLFSLAETARDAGEAPAVLDRLVAAARRKLRDRLDAPGGGAVRVADAYSPSLEATRAYFDGLDCWTGPDSRRTRAVDACPPFFERALELDPSFALAHYWLAVLRTPNGSLPERGRPHIEAALRGVDRLPAREAAHVRAYAAHLAGDDPGALRQYDDLLARFPDDGHALELAGFLLEARSDYEGAARYWRRLLELDPEQDQVAEGLVVALSTLGRQSEVRRLLGELRARPPTPARARAVVMGLVRLGDVDEAVAEARRAEASLRSPEVEGLLRSALETAGAYAEVEPRYRAALDPADPRTAEYLAAALAALGRVREAFAVLDEAHRRDERGRPEVGLYVRAMLLGAAPDPARLWPTAARVAALNPSYGEDLAVVLALRGDLAHAAQLARTMAPGAPVRRQYEALLAWRGGDAATGLARLGALEAADPWPADGLLPAYLAAEVAAAAGEHRETLAAVERYRRLWQKGYWRAWAWPRTLYLAARAHAALGDRDAARREVDRLLALWRRADPDLPLLREARALRARL